MSTAAPRRIALVDPGAYVLPYLYQLVWALAARGDGVSVWLSSTRYNAEFLQALRALPGVVLHERAISSSVAPRWRGALAYLAQLASLLRHARRHDLVNLQWVGAGPWWLEGLVFGGLLPALGVPLALTVHNAVPHGFAGRQHRPTRWLATRAARLIFASQASRDDFLARYGETFRTRCALLPHGLLPLTPQAPLQPCEPLPRPEALVFWGRVQPYKGVELFAELARSDALRQRGLALEVHGAWATELHPLRDQLTSLGVRVVDTYLDEAALQALMRRPVLFLLPYQRATQSGAMYALLHHGRCFACSDSGDLGQFMRTHGLQDLLLGERSAAAVLAVLDRLAERAEPLAAAFAQAQQAMGWERLLRIHPEAYAPLR
ncbi:glycosyltransferase [Ideonella sp. 4Y11]|uniref:Glycosyltransferase n=1 Tax=Ideonella aquatica TaxID=2824119 RepID=A0A940YI96_9BURK|nr:glycosyltransferase [Ideonella aquatica]MBQ0958324.1 glycosyltransferase [Ideonella aquatica]